MVIINRDKTKYIKNNQPNNFMIFKSSSLVQKNYLRHTTSK